MGVDNYGIAVAFCPLLWQANGGQLTAEGVPIAQDDAAVRGNCKNPFDCYRCDIMHNTLLSLVERGVSSLWVCPRCSSEATKLAKEMDIPVRLPGFYSEGYCQRANCHRAVELGEEGRYSTLLQLLTVHGTNIP